MSRLRRVAMLLAVAACLGAVAVLFALRNAASWVEANREALAARAAAALGRSVSVGDVGLSFFPALAVRIADVHVGDDPAWSDESFVVADAAEVVVAILPALRRRIDVQRIRLDGLAVTIIRDGERYNLDSLGRGGEGRAGPAASGAGAGGGGVAGLPLAVDTVSVHDASLRLIDRRGDRQTAVEASEVDVTMVGGDLAEAVRVDGRAAVLGADRQNAVVSGRIGPIDLADLDATPLDVEVQLDAVDVARARTLPEVAAVLPPPLAVDGPVDATVAVTGRLGAPAFEGHLDATHARVTWAEWFRKPAGLRLRLTATGRRAGAGASLERFELRLAEMIARGSGDASPERVALHVEASPSPASGLVAVVPALDAWRVRGEIGLRADVTGRVDHHRLPSVTGEVSLRDLAVAADDPALHVTGLTQTIALRGDVAELPPTSLVVNGTAVTVAGRLENFASSVVTMRNLDVRALGGRVTGTIVGDRTDAKRPAFSSSLEWMGVDVTTLAALTSPSASARLSGRVSGHSELRGAGLGGREMRRTLHGSGRAAIADGVLRGVNLGSSVLAGLTRLPGFGKVVPARVREKYPGIFGAEDTHFEEMTGRWRVVDGVVHFDRLAIVARDFSVTGQGTLDRANRLDVTGTLQASRDLSGDLVGVADFLRYVLDPVGVLAIPFSIEGVWPDVRVRPDEAGLARTLPGQVLEGGLRELLGGKDADEPSGRKKGLLRRGLDELLTP